jgi:hypothetical protein
VHLTNGHLQNWRSTSNVTAEPGACRRTPTFASLRSAPLKRVTLAVRKENFVSSRSFPLHLLHYPREVVDKAVYILATHEGQSRQRLMACRSELALLPALELPPQAQQLCDEIFARLYKVDRNKTGMYGIKNATASSIACLVLALQSELDSMYEDIKRLRGC